MKGGPPEPADKRYVAMVKREVALATERAWDCVGLVRPTPGKACKRCGISHDLATPGCAACYMRHYLRRRAGKA